MSQTIPKALKVLRRAVRLLGALPGILLGVALGLVLYWGLSPAHKGPMAGPAAPTGEPPPGAATVWTCSMHPEINLPEPGLCPKCGMKLIPRTAAADEKVGLRVFTASENAKALMSIETAAVERLFPTAQLRMIGKVDYDETRLAYITAWVDGRLDRLSVDYTGVAVSKGDDMVWMYSPELYSAQAELLEALAAVRSLQRSDVDVIRRTAQATVEAAREKLRLLGLTGEQVAAVERRGQAEDHVTIHAPVSGIVIHKSAQQGMYVQTGTQIYTIADLSEVWVKLDAYESDLAWLRYGQKVDFTSVSYPGQTFTGTIAFIDPVLNPTTRTAKVRVNVPNPDGKLKPEMFVHGVTHSQVAAGGRVLDPALAGKWISPRHPEIVKDVPGTCDRCGMALVPAETLGYVGTAPTDADKPLVIPASAPLITGTRAIVYVEIDPSVFRWASLLDWDALAEAIRPARAASTPDGKFANTRCPIMGSPIDPASVPEDLTRRFQGRTVAFCCAGCPAQWDALSDAEKQARLAAAQRQPAPLSHLRALLSAPLREQLDAVPPGQSPPPATRELFLRELNALLEGPALYDPDVWKDVPLPAEAQALRMRGLDRLPPRSLRRLNRLLLAVVLPEVLTVPVDQPTYEGREIVLGPRAGDYYLVRRGLEEGEHVVTRGNFKIDSALQIEARPSMMTPDGGGAPAHEHGQAAARPDKAAAAGKTGLPDSFVRQAHAVLGAADKALAAAAADDLAAAQAAFAELGRAVGAVEATALEGHAHKLWMDLAMRLGNDAFEGRQAKEPADVRRAAQSLAANAASLRGGFAPSHGGHAASAPAQTAPAAEHRHD